MTEVEIIILLWSHSFLWTLTSWGNVSLSHTSSQDTRKI